MFRNMAGLATSLIAALAVLAACDLGRVQQGRVVDYDKAKGVMTVVFESDGRQPAQPKYVAPGVAVKIPVDPDEMGPAPEPGKLLVLNPKNREIVFYDCASKTLKTINYAAIAEESGVHSDDVRVAGAKFPVIDRRKKTVTLYAARERTLVTLLLEDQYLGYPDDTWKAGDEVRFYYKQPGQALRLMNVSKTDLNKAAK